MSDLSVPNGLDDAIEEIIYEEKCISEFARQHVLFNPVTRQAVPVNCKSWRCPKHGPSWQHKWKVIVSRETAVNPVNKLITLTCASQATPAQLINARRSFFRAIRSKYGQFEYFSVLEFTTESRLPHLHILARGKYIRQSVISDYWRVSTHSAGIKASYVVHIAKPKDQIAASHYALSYALNGTAKGQDIPADWSGRKITYSKGFFASASTADIWKSYIRETFGSATDTDVWYMMEKTRATTCIDILDGSGYD